MPDSGAVEVAVLLHEEDAHLVDDVADGVSVSVLPAVAPWRLVSLGGQVEGFGAAAWSYAPLGPLARRSPTRGCFTHPFVCEWRFLNLPCVLSVGERGTTPLCLPSGRPLSPLDSLLHSVLYATEGDAGQIDVVAGDPLTAIRRLLDGDRLTVELTRRYGDDLPIAAIEAVDGEFCSLGAELFWRVYFGEGDYWLLTRAEADRRHFI